MSHYQRYFFFNDTATTEIYTLSLHDALPIYLPARGRRLEDGAPPRLARRGLTRRRGVRRSEEHTSELQSQSNLVCRLLLEKKTKIEAIATAQHNLEHLCCRTACISYTARVTH